MQIASLALIMAILAYMSSRSASMSGFSIKEAGVDPLMPLRIRRCRERWEH